MPLEQSVNDNAQRSNALQAGCQKGHEDMVPHASQKESSLRTEAILRGTPLAAQH